MAKCIAIVEDDPDQRSNYVDAITKKGYEVVAYSNRQEALAGFERELPDLAILDIILGDEVDAGFEICRGIAEHFDWAHSVDRLKIAQRLDSQRPHHAKPLNVCIQVHMGDDARKSGAAIQDIPELAQAVAGFPHLSLRGLMCIPPPEPTPDRQRAHFAKLRTVFEAMQATWPSCDTLSMGMTGDMEAAIAEGSTMLRIGTAIFGQRPT